MNPDAHKEAERLLGALELEPLGVTIPHEVHEALIAAMRWAYADAVKTAESCREVIGEHRVAYIIRAVEARAK